MTIKVKTKKMKCTHCGKSDGSIKFYIIHSTAGTPKPYHPDCVKKLKRKTWK